MCNHQRINQDRDGRNQVVAPFHMEGQGELMDSIPHKIYPKADIGGRRGGTVEATISRGSRTKGAKTMRLRKYLTTVIYNNHHFPLRIPTLHSSVSTTNIFKGEDLPWLRVKPTSGHLAHNVLKWHVGNGKLFGPKDKASKKAKVYSAAHLQQWIEAARLVGPSWSLDWVEPSKPAGEAKMSATAHKSQRLDNGAVSNQPKTQSNLPFPLSRSPKLGPSRTTVDTLSASRDANLASLRVDAVTIAPASTARATAARPRDGVAPLMRRCCPRRRFKFRNRQVQAVA